MNDTAVTPAREPARFEAASLYVLERPAESMATLTEMEFRILADGDLNEAKSGMASCFGISASAAIGGIGLLATINWGDAFQKANWLPFVWTGIMVSMAIATFACGIVYWRRYGKTRNSSAYSSLMKRLREGFPETNTTS
jgi:hypothetical protein